VNAQAALPANITDGEQALGVLEKSLLDGDISRQTHETIRKQLADPKVTERAYDDPVYHTSMTIGTGTRLK